MLSSWVLVTSNGSSDLLGTIYILRGEFSSTGLKPDSLVKCYNERYDSSIGDKP